MQAAPVIFHVGLCMSGLEVTLRPLWGRCLGVLPTDRPGVARPADPPGPRTAASGVPTDRPVSSPPGDAQTQLNFAPPKQKKSYLYVRLYNEPSDIA